MRQCFSSVAEGFAVILWRVLNGAAAVFLGACCEEL